MIRSELLQLLAKENADLRAEDVERAVDIFFDEIAARLAKGGRVELRGFGAFSTRQREARKGRNPRTGETSMCPASACLFQARQGNARPAERLALQLRLACSTTAIAAGRRLCHMPRA